MRAALCLIAVVGCVAAQAALAGPAEKPQRTIPCSEIIDVTRFPYLGSSQRRYQSRLVLGSVSVPPARLVRSYPSGDAGPWRYFAKHGMVVRSGTAVTITVPSAWRTRVAISWGNAVQRVFHTIRIAACAADPGRGHAYAGGFYLRSESGCVPLVFAVGAQRKTVWFGIGRDCP